MQLSKKAQKAKTLIEQGYTFIYQLERVWGGREQFKARLYYPKSYHAVAGYGIKTMWELQKAGLLERDWSHPTTSAWAEHYIHKAN